MREKEGRRGEKEENRGEGGKKRITHIRFPGCAGGFGGREEKAGEVTPQKF